MMGPVQMLMVGFNEPDFRGEILKELDRLRDDDVIRLIDLVVVKKDDEGNVTLYSDKDMEAAAEFGATVGALIGLGAGVDDDDVEIAAVRGAESMTEDSLDDPDVWYAADAIPNGTAAAVALLEHRWAVPLRDAIGRAGGFHLADAWIHPRDLVAVGLIAAEEAEAAEEASAG
jgi:uncharacterized membrane protein